MEILGRKEDGQIKLHGRRLELGEIETAIGACQCLPNGHHFAAAKVNINENPILAVFILLPGESGTAALPNSIFERPSKQSRTIMNNVEDVLRGLLPDYMIPRLWMPVSSWPFAPSGKTDRKYLAAACEALSPANIMDYQRSRDSPVEHEEPVSLTNTEKVIEDAWKLVLRKENDIIIGPEDDFFKLGGDSLGAIRLISALRIKNLCITAQEIFMTKSLRGMAHLIDSKTPNNESLGATLTSSSPTKNADEKRRPSSACSSHKHLLTGGDVSADSTKWDSNSSTTHFNEIEQASAFSKDEKRLRRLWASALHRSEHLIARNDNFFSCGGDAMSVLHLSRIASVANIHLSDEDIHAYPTLSKMTNFIQTSAREGSIPPFGNDIEDITPASHTQLAFLIEGQRWCQSYYTWEFIEIGHPVPIAKIQEVCQIVAQRHPILQTCFHLIGRQCYQVIRRNVCDFKVLFYDGFPDQMCARLNKDVKHPVRFKQMLTRFRLLINVKSGRQMLALGLSHAQYDGFSLPTILNDLRLAYLGKLPNNRTSPSYSRFIEHTLQIPIEDANAFWRETLKGSSITSIVRETSSPFPVLNQGMLRSVPFNFKHSGDIHYAVMLKAAWALVLSRLSQSTDVTFWSVVSGRFAAFEGAQDVVGPCLNLIPIRVRIDPDQRFGDLLQHIFEQQVAAIPYESASFDPSTRQTLWPESTRYESVFHYQNLPNHETSEEESSDLSSWTTAGTAAYGGGLVQKGGCWLVAWPEEHGSAGFCFKFCEETMSPSKADSTFDLFSKILHAINENLDDRLYSALSFPIDERFLMGENHLTSAQEAIHFHQPPSQSIPRACRETMESLVAIWVRVLHPSPGKIDQDCTIEQDESFFDLGGDSISAAEVTSFCSEAGFDLTLQDIIDFQTLRLQTLLISGLIDRPARDPLKLLLRSGN